MSKREIKTDLWVRDLLRDAGVELDAQGSGVKEIDEALKSASKRGTGNVGYPEYVGVVGEFLLVIEDKADMSRHEKRGEAGELLQDTDSIVGYALNGALFYARHLAAHTPWRRALAFGVSGNERRHRITPLYVEGADYRVLPDVESFISFNAENIEEYYIREVLGEDTDAERETAEILRDAAALHEDLRNYGNLKDTDKPLVVSGILLALNEQTFRNFAISDLNGDPIKTDGQKIFEAIEAGLRRANVSPDVKRDKLLAQFAIIRDTQKLNEPDASLGKTPLRYFTEFLNEKIFRSIKYASSAEDYVGRFYGEFMSYSGGDGQTLGIILTPKHITELFCDLVDLRPEDVVLDPCCGTAGFLIAAMHRMTAQVIRDKGLTTRQQVEADPDVRKIRRDQLYGLELQPYMFTIATTNMILRGDGKSNLVNEDFLRQDAGRLQLRGATVGMMNPPYSQGSSKNPDLYELNFVAHLLDSLTPGARCAVILPQSSMTGKTRTEQSVREDIYRHHTLEGVITLNPDTFYNVGVIPCVAVFTAGQPHPADKACRFINFEDDGYRVAPHVGLIETEAAVDRRRHLLDVWTGKLDAPTRFCVTTKVEPTDEWLHSFYYFNDELPNERSFEEAVADYMTFEFSMIARGRGYLFERGSGDVPSNGGGIEGSPRLGQKEWGVFTIGQIATISSGRDIYYTERQKGDIPYISSSSVNNGVCHFVSNTNETLESGCISVNRNGSVGYAFYHPYEALYSNDCRKLRVKASDKHTSIFIAHQISGQRGKYSYGYKMGTGRLKRQNILLPATIQGQPDYRFMRDYIKELERQKVERYIAYCKRQLSELGEAKEIPKLEEKEWRAFYITDIFDAIQRGRRLKNEDHIPGRVPYASSSAVNNGIDDFVGNKEGVRKFEDCIALANSGSVGTAFYHPYAFVASDHVTSLKSKGMSSFVYLFLCAMLRRLSGKYNFNREINDLRIRKEHILLPATEGGQPDYAYMEQYVRNLMTERYKLYLNYAMEK